MGEKGMDIVKREHWGWEKKGWIVKRGKRLLNKEGEEDRDGWGVKGRMTKNTIWCGYKCYNVQ